MKTKKWQVVTIVSLVAILVEVVLFFVLTLPAMRKDKIFKELEAGNATEAADLYDKLSSGQQKKFNDKLDDFGTYEVNQYIKGELTYKEVSKVLTAASKLDKKKTGEIMQPYMDKAACVELVNLYEKAVQDYIENQDTYNDVYRDCSQNFSEIYYSLDEEEAADTELYNYLDAKYTAFNDGDLTVDEMDAYSRVGQYFFSYGTDEYDLADDINSKIYYIKTYQQDLDIAQEYYDNEQYFECIDYCDNELEWTFYNGDNDTGYEEKFQNLRDDAYDAGKDYYLEKAETLANSGFADDASDILTKMDDLYGDDVDTSAVWALTRPAWKTAYIDFMKDYEAHIRADIVSGVKIGTYDDPSTLNYDDYEPYRIYLYDFDANGTPELMLRADDYYYYIYTCDGSNVKYTGTVYLVAMTDVPYLLTTPISAPESTVQAYELLKFANGAWTVESYYLTDGNSYEVNGAPASEDEARALHDEYDEMQNTSAYLDYTDIAYYESFILDYED